MCAVVSLELAMVTLAPLICKPEPPGTPINDTFQRSPLGTVVEAPSDKSIWTVGLETVTSGMLD